MKCRYAALLLSALLLTACGTADTPAAPAAAAPAVYQITEHQIDLSFFKKHVYDEPEPEFVLGPAYDTEISSADGKALAALTKGEWTLTEDGEKYKALLETVTPDAVVGPEIRNILRIDTAKTDAALEIMQSGNIEGSVIVSDPQGRIELICNNPPDKDFSSAPNFNGSTAKIFVATAMLDHNVDQYYDDPGFYDPGWHKYYNHDTAVPYAQPVRRDLLNAFKESSNAYFMHAICELLTHEQIIETYNKYYGYNLFGTALTGYYYPADWMNIPQPDWENLRGNLFERGKSAIGLSNEVLITPLYLNAVTGAIASDGLYQLSLWQSSSPQQLTEAEPLPDALRSTMWNMMRETAKWTSSAQLSDLNGYSFYIKTGTGDTRYGEHNEYYLKRLLMTGFLAKDGKAEKVITIYCHNGADNALGGSGGLSLYFRQIAELMMS